MARGEARPGEAPDAERVLGARAGEGCEDSFRALAARHARGVADLVRRLVPDRSAVDDLVQEALLRAWAQRARYEPRYAYSTWLYRIAVNLCRDHGRRRLVRERAPAPEPPPAPEEPLGLAARREEAARVRAALARLDEDEREVVTLRVYQGLSFAEAAAVLEVPASTLKSRMQRALRRLREELTAEVAR